MNTAASDLKELAQRMLELGSKFDRAHLRELAPELIDRISSMTEPVTEDTYLPALDGLRRARVFDELGKVCEALARIGAATPAVRNLHAQALIELAQVSAALDMLQRVKAETRPGGPDHMEALGLLGRAYKQIYVDEKREPRSQWAGDFLRRSISNYAQGYLDNQDMLVSSWHCVNVATLLLRARRDGLAFPAEASPDQLADEIIAALEPRLARAGPTDDANVWYFGTIAGAYAVRGDWEAAAKWFGRYAQHPGIDSFKLIGTTRQLEEVWQIKPGDDDAGRILTSLKARALSLHGGRSDFTPADLAAFKSLSDGHGDAIFEAVLGENAPKRVKWLKTGLTRAQSVARVGSGARGTTGTGFLVMGREFDPALGEELFLLTNNHVVSTLTPNAGLAVDPLMPHEVEIRFDEDRESSKFLVKEIAWQSPIHELDATLLRFKIPPPSPFEPLPLVADDAFPDAMSEGMKRRNAFIIGHPKGNDLSISLQDSELIDVGYKDADKAQFTYLHYKTPTEPGNSGSPVFEENEWQVIGLHHAATDRRRSRLQGKSGESPPSNEGIAIRSIRNQIQREKPWTK